MTNKDGEIGVPGLKRTISSHGYLTAPTPTTTGGRGFLARETLTAARLVHRWAPSLTDETLAYAAKWQGAVGDSKWGQQVGKIPGEIFRKGELRTGTHLGLPVEPSRAFATYFSADVTAEWLVTLAVAADRDPRLRDTYAREARSAGDHLLRELALGGGLVRWGPRPAEWTGTGLLAQGWRESRGIEPPTAGAIVASGWVADWDVQGPVLLALRALHRLTDDRQYLRAAHALAVRIDRSFETD